MTQRRLTVTRTIDAPVEQVWEVLTDLPNAADRLSGIDRVEIMTSGPYAVGTRWRETRTLYGQSATEEMWVRFNDPLRSTVVQANHGDIEYNSTWRLREIEEASDPESDSKDLMGDNEQARSATTELSLDFSAVGPDGPVATGMSAVLGPLGLRATTKAMKQDMDDINDAASALAAG